MTVLAQAHHNPADDAYQQAVAAAHRTLTDTAVVDVNRVRTPVSESWQRCLKFHPTPEQAPTPETLSAKALAVHRQQHPITAVLPMLETLLAPAHQVGLITAICNTAGHLLWVDGASSTRRQAETIGFAPGADWSEASMGTSAPGATLSTGAPAQVAGAEHFAHTVHQFHCSAVPLHHPSGGLLGVLDITGNQTAVTPLARALLANAAATIEAYWATRSFPLHTQPEPAQEYSNITVATTQPRLGQHRLSLRHAEILTLLASSPAGCSALQLVHGLFGEPAPHQVAARLTTVRAEMSRLRKFLARLESPLTITSQPYRLDTAVTTDFNTAMAALHRGDLSTALHQAPTELLPASDAPGIRELRSHFNAVLREAVLADATADQLWTYLSRPQATHDVEAWTLALQLLAPHSPRRALVLATLDRLTG